MGDWGGANSPILPHCPRFPGKGKPEGLCQQRETDGGLYPRSLASHRTDGRLQELAPMPGCLRSLGEQRSLVGENREGWEPGHLGLLGGK